MTYTLLNEYGIQENTLHFTYNGLKPVYKLSSYLGANITGTFNHPLRVLNEEGVIVWKEISDIVENDYLVGVRVKDTSKHVLSKVQKAEATLVGLLLADGTLSNDTTIRFSNTDPCVVSEFKKSAKTLFGEDILIKVYKGKDYQIDGGDAVRAFYKRVGFELPAVAKDKKLSTYVRSQSTAYLKTVLRSYIECECHVSKERSTIEVSSASQELLLQVKYILQTVFGMVAYIRPKDVKLDDWEEARTYYRLFLSGVDYDIYGEEVGFISKARKQSFGAYEGSRHSNLLGIPNLGKTLKSLYQSLPKDVRSSELHSKFYGVMSNKCNLTADNWFEILDTIQSSGDYHIKSLISSYFNSGLFFDKVVSKTEEGVQPTFDFEMQETASFLANGIRSHNTSICMSAVAQAQKQYPELMVLYIDTEQAFDLNYAKKFGVNVEEDVFMFVQPESAEQALQIMREMAETSAFSLIVLDSVAAMATEAQLGKDSDEKTMGSLAGVLSPELNKIKTALSKHNTTGIFINQIREKIGYVLSLQYEPLIRVNVFCN